MGISLGSINTGLPKDIVQQLMKAERIPVEKIQAKKGKLNEKKTLVLELEKLIETLETQVDKNGNARNLKELKVDTNESIIGVTVDKNVADTGEYQFEVVRLAQKSSAMTTGFADKDKSYIGVGFIRYSLPDGTTKRLYVDSDNASLTKVAQLINYQSDIGVRATVVNDGSGSDTPYRLILSLLETGDEERAEFPYLYFVDGDEDFSIDQERKAQDALIKLDGFKIETPDNVITDLIPGTVIDLKKAAPKEEFTIKISEDIEAIADKIHKIVESINGIFSFIQKQNSLDSKTDTSRTLGGDSILQSLESRLRRIVFHGVATDYGKFRAGDIGITFTRKGILKFNREEFAVKMSRNYNRVAQILIGRSNDEENILGLIQNLKTFANNALQGPAGIIHSRKQVIQSNMKQIDKRIEQRERMLEKKEKTLKNKFARLEATIARLKTQEAGVAALGGPTPSLNQSLG